MRFPPLVLSLGLAALLSAAASVAEVGVWNKKILLGQSAVFTGHSAELGLKANLGASVYFAALNARGGVAGREIELRKDDDNFEPAMAASNTEYFLEQDKVFALFGYVGTANSNAALPMATKAKALFFAPFSGAEILREPLRRHVFNIRASVADEAARIVEHLAAMGIKRIAAFYQKDEDGQSGLRGVGNSAKKAAMTLVEAVGVDRNAMEIPAAGVKLLEAKPDAVVLICPYEPAAALIMKMRAAGYAGLFYSASLVGSGALSAALGKDGRGVIISQVVPSPWSPKYAIVAEYQKAMKDAGHREFDFSSMEGYIAAKVFAEIARKVGRDLTRERFIEAAESMASINVGDFIVNFSPTSHNGSRFVEMVMIGRDGGFVR